MVSKEQLQYIFEPHKQIFGTCFAVCPLRVIVPHLVSYYTRMPIRLALLSYLLVAAHAFLHATQTHLIPSGSYLQISLGIFLGGDQEDTNHQYDLSTFSQSLIFTFQSVPYNILIFPSMAPKAFDQLGCYKKAVSEGVPDIMCKFERVPYPNCKECLEEAMSHGERVSACLNCAQPHLGIASNNTVGTTVLIIDNSHLLTGGDGRDLIVEAQAALGMEVASQESIIFSIFAGVAGFLLLVALGVALRLNQLIKKCQSLKAS